MYDKAIDLICRFEGFKPTAYKCPAGVWTIGYGRTENVRPDSVTTVEQERSYVESHARKIATAIQKVVTTQLTENQLNALISFSYNVGIGAFSKSTMLKLINQGKFEQAALEFPKWNKAGGRVLNGLTRRREAEQQLFMSN